eukprot:NODE_4436_length_662_cov_49.773246_g3788_i0.p2 GENE.NODE_4436_length_662_cov_49.773246_g3788_i0~~NODE_4436_length_662_cov_49.773246_g3788_i0.p2  ORF type:complete len:179 (+),score=48.85 NODE_4436_length_662_cov_49.773246_g3788_i0:49-585(+)
MSDDKKVEDPKIEDASEKKDEEVPALENQDEESKKFNRGEKKCRKALLKLGMKQLTGVDRVTLKKREGLVFVISDPEVLHGEDNSFAIFGELKLDDPNQKLLANAAAGLNKKPAEAVAKADEKKDEAEEDDSQPLSEDGLTASNIDMVMQHTGCTRNKAIKALKKSNDDMVNAIMQLS